jgi:hypothetical protein
MASVQEAGQGWSMAGRGLTALIGGYGAAAGLATLLARLLPVERVEATAWGMILSFLFYAAFGLWAFYEPRLTRVAAAIWGTAVVAGGAALLLGVRP